MSNHKHAHEYCPRCHTNKYTLLDEHHAEVYCDKCGLVIRDSTINTIRQQEKLKQYQMHQLYRLHYKKKG